MIFFSHHIQPDENQCEEPNDLLMDNIPTVQVNELDGSRRLKSVIEKVNLFDGNELSHVISGCSENSSHLSEGPQSLSGEDSKSKTETDTSLLVKSSPIVAPPTPASLLSAPEGLPISMEDIREFLPEEPLSQRLASSQSKRQTKLPTIKISKSSSSNFKSAKTNSNDARGSRLVISFFFFFFT